MGISFFPYAKFDLKTMSLIGQPYYSGAEAVFNFAVNVYTLDMLRSLGQISQSKVKAVAGRINVGKILVSKFNYVLLVYFLRYNILRISLLML